MKPVTMNHRGCPSLRMASAVWRACSIWDKSVSGSLSSTSESSHSIAAHTLISLRLSGRYSFSLAFTKSTVWCRWLSR